MFRSLPLLIRRPSQFVPLCSNSIIRPTRLAYLQTDGSYSIGGLSRTAVILKTISGENYNLVNTYLDHANSTESEWCSILNGLQYSLKRGQQAINLENDNLGVVNSLIRQEAPNNRTYYRYYRSIYSHLANFEWVNIRWIPRELNKADKLFRI